jgi:hypothetical protein
MKKGNAMPCPDKKSVRSYLTAAERDRLNQIARKAGLSLSRFMRDVCLGYKVRSFEHEEFKLDLLKTRAELGRLGGLLKLALSAPGRFGPDDQSALRELLGQLAQRQNEIKAVMERL